MLRTIRNNDCDNEYFQSDWSCNIKTNGQSMVIPPQQERVQLEVEVTESDDNILWDLQRL